LSDFWRLIRDFGQYVYIDTPLRLTGFAGLRPLASTPLSRRDSAQQA